MDSINNNFWRKCSSCKKEIPLKSKYYECSVSTCTGIRTGYVFCSISCFETHLPGAKHRNAGAIEKISPATTHSIDTNTYITQPVRRLVNPQVSSQSHTSTYINNSSTAKAAITNKSAMSDEVLIVVSKTKQFIKDLSDMNTSEEVNQVLSDLIRRECEKAIASARNDGRKTVMARDFK